jgi:exopolyphosphatase/guanosine-5'-triphosphate,3'-diphosphate pyrophosphatase
VVDVGGGSAEVVWTGGRVSTELGVVRLTERHVASDPPGLATLDAVRAAVRARLAALPLPRPAPALVASGSSGPLLARLHLGLATHDSARIHGAALPLAAVSAMATRFATATQAERLALPGMDASRADVALAGAVVLEQAALAAGVDALVVNERSTRYGVFHRAFG